VGGWIERPLVRAGPPLVTARLRRMTVCRVWRPALAVDLAGVLHVHRPGDYDPRRDGLPRGPPRRRGPVAGSTAKALPENSFLVVGVDRPGNKASTSGAAEVRFMGELVTWSSVRRRGALGRSRLPGNGQGALRRGRAGVATARDPLGPPVDRRGWVDKVWVVRIEVEGAGPGVPRAGKLGNGTTERLGPVPQRRFGAGGFETRACCPLQSVSTSFRALRARRRSVRQGRFADDRRRVDPSADPLGRWVVEGGRFSWPLRVIPQKDARAALGEKRSPTRSSRVEGAEWGRGARLGGSGLQRRFRRGRVVGRRPLWRVGIKAGQEPARPRFLTLPDRPARGGLHV